MQLRKKKIKKIFAGWDSNQVRCYPLIDRKFLPQAGKSKLVVNFPEYSVLLVRKESAIF